ncbi:glutamate receptor ionotropic, kainate 1-like isoform X3 [Artemia franciscana]|uniref:glutamate receptor ionotropic, kainate 1-like isoform X3 n=1 Tax=Artemia franciscana TaxID=6661 RepID=UPI0032DA91AC
MKKCVKWKGSDHRKVSFECSVGKNCRNSFYCGMILYFFVFSSLINLSSCLPPVIKIGAIFVEDQKDSAAELAFKYAVYRLNKERSILPNTTLMYDIQYVPKEDTFHTSKTACKQISNGVQAVFGPSDPLLGAHIQSICDALEIPHLESRLDTEIHVKGSQEFTVNLHPSQELLNSAYKDLMTYLNWTKVAIVYEENGAETVNSKGLIRLQDLVRTPTKNTEVYIRQATPSTYRHVMDELKQREMFNIIIDTKPETIQLLFRAILQLQMNDYRYHYFFTSLDVETFDLEDFKYNSVNITAFRLVDSENIRSRLLLRDMERFQPIGHSILNKTNVIKTAPALMFDSVMSLAHGLAALDRGATLRIANVSCEDEKPWSDGTSLFNYVNTVEFQGLTGPVRFQDGRRANFKLDLLKLRRDELLKVGEWKQQSGLNITAPKYFFEGGSPNITLIVMTNEEVPYVMLRDGYNSTDPNGFEGFCIDLLKHISRKAGFNYQIRLSPDGYYGSINLETGEWNGIVKQLIEKETPYVMLRHNAANLTGNARYEGFCVDLLKAISAIVGFQYVIEFGPDKIYGAPDPDTGEWNGLVKQLIEKKADLAVGSMTINYARENVIDFTKPFMNLGISILFKIPSSQPTRLFSFMNPLAIEIWLYVLAAFVLVSFTLFVMARFSPYEWQAPHPCLKTDFVVNQFSVSNSFWFITGTFLRQGSGLNPKVPGKIPPQLFSFMNPLAIEIWMSILVAYTLVSLTLWLIARFSPFEWVDVHPCLSNSNQNGRTPSSCKHQTPVVMKQNDFTMGNAFWFTVGSLMQQGSDLNPQAASTRIVGGIWWFFTLIIISSYTANLAAFLTVERMITPIESAEDLADQSEIAYGTLGGGSTMTFFRDSKIETYQKMWRFMESKQPSVFVSAYDEGINRVLEGNYAFLMESTTLDYVVQRNCNLTQIGGLLDSKGYGIATQKGSPWRDKISLAILELQENGIIQMLYSKWWRGTGDICNRDEKKKESKANALGIENIGGVFVVLLCGLALAIVVAILEFCWNSKKNAQMDRQSLCSEMAEELRFALRCQGSRQRPALRRPCSRCAQQATGPAYISSNENGMLPMLERRKSGVQSFEIET